MQRFVQICQEEIVKKCIDFDAKLFALFWPKLLHSKITLNNLLLLCRSPMTPLRESEQNSASRGLETAYAEVPA
jgi:hypothetical protein